MKCTCGVGTKREGWRHTVECPCYRPVPSPVDLSNADAGTKSAWHTLTDTPLNHRMIDAFVHLVNTEGNVIQHYRGDIARSTVELLHAPERKPVAVCLRDYGVEICFDSSAVRITTMVFGEGNNANWYMIVPNPRSEDIVTGCTYRWCHLGANACHNMLRELEIIDSVCYANDEDMPDIAAVSAGLVESEGGKYGMD